MSGRGSGSGSQRDDAERRRPPQPVAGDFPASKAHHEEIENEGPTPGEEMAQDTNVAAQERGAHSEEPVGGTPRDDDKP